MRKTARHKMTDDSKQSSPPTVSDMQETKNVTKPIQLL